MATKRKATNKKLLRRTAEYRRALATLPAASVGVALACYAFSSIHQKIRFAKAMASIEGEPGFAGWGRFYSKPPRGPAHAVAKARG